MVKQFIAITLFTLVVIAGCSSSMPTSPEADAPSGWVVEYGDASLREANPYIDITTYAMPAIHIKIDAFVPHELLELTLTLTNSTIFTPRNVDIAFSCPMEDPDGMTDRYSEIPWDFRLFNDGDPVLTGVPYEVDIHLDISEGGLTFGYFIMGLFGPDPLDETFVYEDSNNWYDFGNHNIMLGKMNGTATDTGIDGKWPMISGNGRFIAAVVNPGIGSHFVIKDTETEELTEIHIDIPGVDNERAGWGIFDYEGNYFVYMAGQPQYREYLYMRDMNTGETTIIEGSMDGSEICAAFGIDISGDGTMVSYTCNDNPTDMYSYFNIRTYNTVTKEKIQITNNEKEDCDTTINYDGTRMAYRRGYLIPYNEIHGGAAVGGDAMRYMTIRQGGIPDDYLVRKAATSYITIYELHTVDLITGEDIVVADKVEDPPNFVTDCRMDWAGNWIVYRDQEDQMFSTYTTIYAVSFDGSETYALTDDTTHFKMVPFISGDGLYGGWDVFMGSGGIYATDLDGIFKPIDVGMWPDIGV